MLLRTSTPPEPDGLRFDGDRIWVDGVPWPVLVKRQRNRTRFVLSADRFGHLELRCAPKSAPDRLLTFVADHRDWLLRRVQRVKPGVPFEDGAVLPILGVPVTVVHEPGHHRPPRRDGDCLRVGGEADFLARRIETYLRTLARDTIAVRARALAAKVGRPVGTIRVKDTRSRWGSCSGRGNLNFSWRLILAPEAALDYVIAHEVAHLVHLHHRPDFWALCASLVDGGRAGVKEQEAWFRRNGASLHAYGRGRCSGVEAAAEETSVD